MLDRFVPGQDEVLREAALAAENLVRRSGLS
jgi:hypothetical protein